MKNIIKAFPDIVAHSEAENSERIEWVKITISILTPSLVLLVGLQDRPSNEEVFLRLFLLCSISSMTLTIALGLSILLSKAHLHRNSKDEIYKKLDSGHTIQGNTSVLLYPRNHTVKLKVFQILSLLSVLSLGMFGLCKNF